MIITWHCYSLINCELNISYENEIENISNHYILDLKNTYHTRVNVRKHKHPIILQEINKYGI